MSGMTDNALSSLNSLNSLSFATMNNPQQTQRIYGLDTLRTCAILLVLMSHYGVVVSHKSTFGFLTDIGWMGVDLFFVLSGYLIGNQVLSSYARGARFSLKTFFARRLLRTLPNYYVVLALYFIFPSLLAGTDTASLWSFLTFTQNIGLHFGETFSHSWSLCVEEQFYVVLPLISFMIAGLSKPAVWSRITIALWIIIPIAVRGFSWLKLGENLMTSEDYATHIYYSSFARFDELSAGVLIALLKNFKTDLYDSIMRKGNSLLASGMLMFAMTVYLLLNYSEIEGYGFTFTCMTFGYSLLAASFALLTMAALSPTSLLNRMRVPGAESLALWSYAIYLAHKPLFKLMIIPMSLWQIDTNAPLGIVIVMMAALCGGWSLYHMVETPFMALRAKFFPNTSL